MVKIRRDNIYSLTHTFLFLLSINHHLLIYLLAYLLPPDADLWTNEVQPGMAHPERNQYSLYFFQTWNAHTKNFFVQIFPMGFNVRHAFQNK